MFTAVEQKLLRLALDEAAQPGEIQNSAVKLIESFRRRAVKPEALIQQQPAEWQLSVELGRAAQLKMPFGRHKDRRLDVIEPDYLRWVLRNCDCASLSLRRSIQLVLTAGRRS
jgi:uncharacterized protein (DUF3820 family)